MVAAPRGRGTGRPDRDAAPPRRTFGGVRPDPLHSIGLQFDLAIAREHARARPDDPEALAALAEAAAEAGELDAALAADLALTTCAPTRPDYAYNLACTYGRLARLDEAFEALGRAIDLGWRDGAHMDEDADLAWLRADPRWSALRQRVG